LDHFPSYCPFLKMPNIVFCITEKMILGIFKKGQYDGK
jgi:hypothetical protein